MSVGSLSVGQGEPLDYSMKAVSTDMPGNVVTGYGPRQLVVASFKARTFGFCQRNPKIGRKMKSVASANGTWVESRGVSQVALDYSKDSIIDSILDVPIDLSNSVPVDYRKRSDVFYNDMTQQLESLSVDISDFARFLNVWSSNANFS